VAVPAFGAEGADGRAPVTKAREGQERERRPRIPRPGPAAAQTKRVRGLDAPDPGPLLRHRRCDSPGHVATANV
jgi:hypothetical protein